MRDGAWSAPVDGAALRRWGLLGATSVLDQGILSGTNFLFNIVLARWLPAGQYGAFAVAFALFLLLSGFHNAVILEPMSVIGPAKHADRLWDYFKATLRAHVALSVTAGSILIVAGGLLGGGFGSSPELGQALVGAGAATPFILFLWLARRFAYILRRPRIGLWGSSIYLLGSVGGLAIGRSAGPMSPFGAFGVMSAASLLGGLFVFWRTIPGAREVNSGARGLDFGKVLAESWAYGRWLAGASLLGIAGGQLQTVAAAFAGLEAAAGLRAAQNFVLPMSQVITATATLGLPALSSDFGRGERQRMLRKGRVITFGLTGLACLYGLGVFLLRVPLESIVYGGRYAEYTGVIALMLTVPVFTAASTGYSLILRAGQWPEHYLIATAVSAAVGIPTALVFASRWGGWGAALSVSLTYLAGALASYWLYRVWVAKESRPLGDAQDLTGLARKPEVVTGAREGIDDEGKSP